MTESPSGALGHRIGLDIGGTKIHAVLLSPDLEVVAEERIGSGWGGREVVANAATATRLVLAGAGLGIDEVELIGVGIPGAVDHESGTVSQAVNLGLQHLDLAAALGAEFHTGVHVENDVNAASLGVAMQARHHPEAQQAERSLAYLNLGTGMAAGIVLGGRLWRGARGAAGEIGHIPVDATGPLCTCGQRGCLETMASGSGIAEQWRSERGEAPLATPDLPALALRDPLAAAILGRLHLALASAVRLLVLTMDVEAVVVGGGVTGLGEALFAPVRQRLQQWESASPFLASLAPATRVRELECGTPVAAIGAALAGALPGAPERAGRG